MDGRSIFVVYKHCRVRKCKNATVLKNVRIGQVKFGAS